MKKILFFLTILFSSSIYSQPYALDVEDTQEIQLYFGDLSDLNCCLLLDQEAKAPYRGFLLTPFQLVSIKDSMDSAQDSLDFQLEIAAKTCDQKVFLCQENRDFLIDNLKLELQYYEKLSSSKEKETNQLKREFSFYKIATYIVVPSIFIFGAYLGTKF